MEWLEKIFLFIGAAGLLLGLFAKPWDRRRILTKVRRMNGTVVCLEMGGYSIGWLVGFGSEVHRLEYRDEDHVLHLTEVKSSLFGGASFVSDIVMPEARFLPKNPRDSAAAALVRRTSRYHPEVPSGLPVNEARRPRPKMAASI